MSDERAMWLGAAIAVVTSLLLTTVAAAFESSLNGPGSRTVAPPVLWAFGGAAGLVLGAVVASSLSRRAWPGIFAAVVGAVPFLVLVILGYNSSDLRTEDQVVGSLIDHPAVRRINFTGSTAVGRIVARRAAERLKPVLLELGGKAPLIVLEHADLDEAVKAAAFGAFMNAGQICMSTERIIVVDAIAESFAEMLAAKARSMPAPTVGAQVDDAAQASVAALIDDALAQGARRIAEGSAAVIDGVTSDMRLYHDESFGPVVGIIRVANEEEAIRVANDSVYGLSASVFTRDVVRGLKVARRIRSGICHVNGPTVQDEPQMPFGGVGASGYGRFGGNAGIEAFTELRWITIAGEPGHYPI